MPMLRAYGTGSYCTRGVAVEQSPLPQMQSVQVCDLRIPIRIGAQKKTNSPIPVTHLPYTVTRPYVLVPHTSQSVRIAR
jgi:hypothetical protein